MPLSLGASWPALTSKTTATAAIINSKFEWMMGDILPQANGTLADNTYDIGSADLAWASGYFSDSIVRTGWGTITAAQAVYAQGRVLSAWASPAFYQTLLSETSFNISSVSHFVLITGTLSYVAYNFINAMESANSYAITSTGEGRSVILAATAAYCRIRPISSSDTIGSYANLQSLIVKE